MLLRFPLYAFVIAQIVLDQGVLAGGDEGFKLIQMIVEAASGGQWLLLGSLLVTAIIWVLRRWVFPMYGAKMPVLLDKRFILAISIVGPLAVGLVALVTGGPLTVGAIVSLLIASVMGGLQSVGIYSMQKNWREGGQADPLSPPAPPSSSPSMVIGGPKLK